MRWLSKSACLTRFYKLFDCGRVPETQRYRIAGNFLTSQNGLVYSTELYELSNSVNLQLQNDDIELIKTRNAVAAKLRTKVISVDMNVITFQSYRQYPLVNNLKVRGGQNKFIYTNLIAIFICLIIFKLYFYNIFFGSKNLIIPIFLLQ